jgi:nitric oxide reductase NorE protein
MTRPESRRGLELPDFLWTDDEVEESVRSAPMRAVKPALGHVPGEIGLWVFILGDMTLFAAIMLVFLWERRANPLLFHQSAHQLMQPVGAINTLVLLVSSYLVVRALFAHRNADFGAARRLIAAAIGCAVIFAGLKAVEYHAEISAGHTPASGTFFTFYFVLTGLHLLHVIVGSALLLTWQVVLGRQRTWSATQKLAESIGCYWHMVDLLWVAIFALVYLVSAE